MRIEFSASGERGLVDPFSGDSLGEHIVDDLVVFDNDIGVDLNLRPSGYELFGGGVGGVCLMPEYVVYQGLREIRLPASSC